VPGRADDRPAGELSLIAAFERLLEARTDRLVRWLGDDAAVVRARPLQVTSTDAMVDGVHFRLDHPRVTPADAGHRAMAAALSDLAAMGADTGEAYVVLGHVAGKMRRFRIRILPGDRVRVEMSPYDLSRARIVYRHK